MIKRILGAILLLGGGYCLYEATSRAMYHGRSLMGDAFDPGLPFAALGRNYPMDAILFLVAAWGFIVGLWLVITGESEPEGAGPRGGRIARVMLVNGLLLVSTLLVALVGAKAKAETATVAVFGVVAAGQIVVGLILLLLSFVERPKGWISLIVGAAITLFGAGVGAAAFVMGKGA